jgi:hypothetical protein
MTTRTCTKCKQSKSIDQFNKDKSRPEGLQLWCKSCKNAKRSADRAAKRRQRADPIKRAEEAARRKKKYKETERRRHAILRRDLKTWPRVAIAHIRKRARDTGREFDLVSSDIVVPEICPVLGIPLIAGAEAPLHNRPSVDRFDNERGYTKDNIHVISHRANHLKRDATVDEIRRLLHYMEGDVS